MLLFMYVFCYVRMLFVEVDAGWSSVLSSSLQCKPTALIINFVAYMLIKLFQLIIFG